MLKKIKNYILSLFFNKVDPTSYNCEVFIHTPTAELFVLDKKGKIEGNTNKITTKHMKSFGYSNNTIILTLDRRYFEFLGTL